MSALKAQLTEDMKNAMRARDSVRLNTIRFLLSEIKNVEIDHGVQDDDGVVKVITKEVEKMKDAMNDFANAGRQDLVDEETVKLQIMESYLPTQLTASELETLVKEVIVELGSDQFGAVMKAAMAKAQGRADGTAVSAVVKKLLG